MFFFKDNSLLTFDLLEPGGGNDYNPGSVSVFCAPNPENLTLDQILAKLEKDIKSPDLSDFEVIKTGQIIKWGVNAAVVNIVGGMFGEDNAYIFPANGKMYFVQYVSNSQNTPVKDTTKQIFDNLKFSD